MTAVAEPSGDVEPLRGLERYRLEWLISFVATAHHGGVSAAARALYRSQPRVSSHVAELEQALGAQLFDRSARPVRLTRDGQALLIRAEEVLEALRALSETATGSRPRELRLAAETTTAAYIYPRLAENLVRVWPSSRLALHESIGPVDLTGDSWDLAVAPAFGALPFGVKRVDLWSEPMVAVLHPDHALARAGVEITISSINGPMLINQPDYVSPGLGPLAGTECIPQTAQPQTMIAMVRHGMGVGVLSGLAAMSTNVAGVVLKPIGDTRCRRTVSLWWHHRRLGADEQALRMLAARIPEPAWPWNAQPARMPLPRVAR